MCVLRRLGFNGVTFGLVMRVVYWLSGVSPGLGYVWSGVVRYLWGSCPQAVGLGLDSDLLK